MVAFDNYDGFQQPQLHIFEKNSFWYLEDYLMLKLILR